MRTLKIETLFNIPYSTKFHPYCATVTVAQFLNKVTAEPLAARSVILKTAVSVLLRFVVRI